MSNVKLSKQSISKLNTVKPELRMVVLKAFETMPFDVVVLEGVRSRERQKELVASGASRAMNSKHLTGSAIDLAPYPVDWDDVLRFNIMAEHIMTASRELGIEVKWGGTFKGFFDGPHFELVGGN